MTLEEFKQFKPGDLVKVKANVTKRPDYWNSDGNMDWLLDHEPVKVLDIRYGTYVTILGASSREGYKLEAKSCRNGWNLDYKDLEVVPKHPIANFKHPKPKVHIKGLL